MKRDDFFVLKVDPKLFSIKKMEDKT